MHVSPQKLTNEERAQARGWGRGGFPVVLMISLE